MNRFSGNIYINEKLILYKQKGQGNFFLSLLEGSCLEDKVTKCRPSSSLRVINEIPLKLE